MLHPFMVTAVDQSTPQNIVFGLDLYDAISQYDCWTKKVNYKNDIGIPVHWMSKDDVNEVLSRACIFNGIFQVLPALNIA